MGAQIRRVEQEERAGAEPGGEQEPADRARLVGERRRCSCAPRKRPRSTTISVSEVESHHENAELKKTASSATGRDRRAVPTLPVGDPGATRQDDHPGSERQQQQARAEKPAKAERPSRPDEERPRTAGTVRPSRGWARRTGSASAAPALIQVHLRKRRLDESWERAIGCSTAHSSLRMARERLNTSALPPREGALVVLGSPPARAPREAGHPEPERQGGKPDGPGGGVQRRFARHDHTTQSQLVRNRGELTWTLVRRRAILSSRPTGWSGTPPPRRSGRPTGSGPRS